MSNKREALEAALSTLESERIMAADAQGKYTVEVTPKRIIAAIEKIKAALAEPEQEPVSPGEADFEQVMQERDSYHQTADELAQVIVDITGADIGEHSSANCPWLNALSAGVNFQMSQKAADTSPREKTEREPVAWEHHAKKLKKWLYCMSYNDSYFGEPEGLVKRVTSELNRLIDTSPREKPEQNPTFLVRVAHITEKPTGVFLPTDSPELRSEYLVPVYTSPREWQELSEDEKNKLYLEDSFCAMRADWDEEYKAISAALRAKNRG